MDREFDEIAAARRLLETGHLSAPERDVFGGSVRLSILVQAARVALKAVPFLPPRVRPEHEFDGVLLEQRGSFYWVHEKREAGLKRVRTEHSKCYATLEEAVRQFVGTSGQIDALEILDDLAV